MDITLTPELESALLAKVESGFYRDKADVVYDALRRFLLADDGNWTLEALRREVAIGAEQAARGDFAEGDVLDLIAKRKKRANGTI